MPTANDANVVVFDFDLTLTRWETAGRFFKGLLCRQPWRLAALIVAFNGLGLTHVTELLSRAHLAGWKDRDGLIYNTPGSAIHGPKAMLIDQDAGSGGDFMPYAFKRVGLGPLIEARPAPHFAEHEVQYAILQIGEAIADARAVKSHHRTKFSKALLHALLRIPGFGPDRRQKDRHQPLLRFEADARASYETAARTIALIREGDSVTIDAHKLLLELNIARCAEQQFAGIVARYTRSAP